MTPEEIPVAVVEDHPVYSSGLVEVIETADGLHVIRSSTSLEALMEASLPEGTVVLLDLHLPGVSGPAAVARLVASGLVVLVLSASIERTSVVGAIGAGASGYLDKRADAEAIVAGVRRVADGHSVVPPELASLLLDTEGPHLTARERQVLRLVAEGAPDKTIGRELGITLHTVHAHLDRIRHKTGRRRRADLTRLAIEERLFSPDAERPQLPATMSETETERPGSDPR